MKKYDINKLPLPIHPGGKVYFVQQLDLTMLVAAETPIYDLEPISGMKGLTKLYIQGTEVRSLEPLRNLMELEELNIRDLKGEVSLEPLYGHGKLKRIFNLGTKLNAEDVEEMRAILFDNNGLPSVTERQIDSTSAPSSKPSPVPENPVVPEFPASEESNDISRCREVLMSFISQWSRNSLEDMLEYCSLDWRKENENPKTALFLLMANRTPMSYALYDMQINGDTVTADLIMLIDRNNGKDPQYYSFEIQMIREAEDWYIEPRSLRNYEAAGE